MRCSPSRPTGRVTRGFFAFRRILRESPLMWPFLPSVYMPGTGCRPAGVRLGGAQPSPSRLHHGDVRLADAAFGSNSRGAMNAWLASDPLFYPSLSPAVIDFIRSAYGCC